MDQIRYPEIQQSMLAGTDQLTGAAELKVLFGDDESIPRLHHGSQPFAGFIGNLSLAEKYAGRLLFSPPYPAPQLVHLRKAETFRVLEKHYRGIRYIDPHFNSRRTHQ